VRCALFTNIPHYRREDFEFLPPDEPEAKQPVKHSPSADTKYRITREKRIRRARLYARKLPGAVEGQKGDNATFRAACKILRGFGLSEEECFQVLLEEFNPRCDPPWSERELSEKIRNAREYGKEPIDGKLTNSPDERQNECASTSVPDYRGDIADLERANPSLVDRWLKTNSSDGFHLTDTGNSKIFAMRYGADVRFCKQIGWFVWDGLRWVRDDTGAIYGFAKQMVLDCYSSLADVADQDFREKVFKHLVKSESAKGITSMLALAESERGISIGVGQLDQDLLLFNVLNGTLNLRTGVLQEHRRGDHITRLAPVNYHPQAACRRFEKFLAEIFESSNDLIRFVQQYFGYALTGSTAEQCFAIFYGCGANGKSTLVKTVQRVLGDYASQCGIETFLTKHNGGIPNDLARLHSARAVFASESEDGQRLAESLVKQITGGDLMTARFLHREFFEFEPRFKLFLSTNHKPTIRGTDQAMWRRIRLVPFNVVFPPEKQDKGLLAALWQERDGIFAWIVRGLQDWQSNGLITPPEVANATQDYREDQDVIGQFLDECVYGPTMSALPCNKLYRIYVWWAKKRGEYVHSERRFQSAITERGIKRGRKENYRTYLDIAVEPKIEEEYHRFFGEEQRAAVGYES
jgi:P4 family phage/plasmid primase-like protien